ncbi:MAG: glycerate kinase [Actinobacteria bacterium]|nr:glycerate kinase [Actinomycetota bacterium]
MKLVIAPDSFKGSLSAFYVCEAIERGVRAVLPGCEILKIPLADGGEGTVDALVHATNGSFVISDVSDPLGNSIQVEWGMLGDGKTAVIEMAAASGLPLVPPDKRNPLETTTFGTGQLIAEAIKKGCRKIIVGIGGSATTDFGTGMAQALGVKFFRKDGGEIMQQMNGRLMGEVAAIDLSSLTGMLDETEIFAACDVENPLLGANGAVYVYSPQKGADAERCRTLEKNMENIAKVVAHTIRDVRDIPGAGAAGGLGGGLVAFLNAKLQPGIKLVLDACGFSQRIKDARFIFTGEGKIDEQTVFGKTIAGVTDAARKQNIPVIVLAGSVDVSAATMQKLGLTAAFSICDKPMGLQEAMASSEGLLARTAEQIVRVIVHFYIKDKMI